MLPKLTRETFRKHVTKPSEQVAAPPSRMLIVNNLLSLRMVRNAKEENSRRGGWVRIFPTAETWSLYGSMLEYREGWFDRI